MRAAHPHMASIYSLESNAVLVESLPATQVTRVERASVPANSVYARRSRLGSKRTYASIDIAVTRGFVLLMVLPFLHYASLMLSSMNATARNGPLL